MGEQPLFMRGRRFQKRQSKSGDINHRVWFDLDNSRYEYEQDPRPERGTWHEIDWRHNLYRDIDPDTGEPVRGSEGLWRNLK